MVSIMNLVKRAGWRARLVPFFKCVCLYFAAVCGEGEGEGDAGGAGDGSGAGARRVLVAAVKCAPVLCLLGFVLLQRAHTPLTCRSRVYGWRVSVGLCLSAVGDALLVWPGTLPLAAGMAMFGAAHLAYTAAFGLRPAAPALAAPLFALAAGYTALLTPPPPLRPLVPLYALLLAAMTWRGAARLRGAGGGHSGVCSAVGAGAFLVSDAVLAYSLFNGPVPYKQVVVMSTYYLGQLGIALSATELMRAAAPAHAAPAPAPAPAL